MLIVNRKLTEAIRFGDSIVVTVLNIDGHCVRLGIEAPRSVAINRLEVSDRISGPRRRILPGPPGLKTQGTSQSVEKPPQQLAARIGSWENLCPNCRAARSVLAQVCGCGHKYAPGTHQEKAEGHFS